MDLPHQGIDLRLQAVQGQAEDADGIDDDYKSVSVTFLLRDRDSYVK
jgi:hypothetical protein